MNFGGRSDFVRQDVFSRRFCRRFDGLIDQGEFGRRLADTSWIFVVWCRSVHRRGIRLMRRLDLRMNGRFGQWLGHEVRGHGPLRGTDSLQLSRRQHRDHQNSSAAVGEIQPRAGAGRERAERGAETAQPFEARGARWQQPSSELRYLASMLIGRAKRFRRERCGVRRAERPGADRIGPENPRAVCRPQPCGQAAGSMNRQPWIGFTPQLEIRTVHLHCMTDGLGFGMPSLDGQRMTALTDR